MSSSPFKWFLVDLWRRISEKGDDDMALDLSPQEIKDIGKMWGSSLFTPEDFKDYFDSLPLKGQRTFFSNIPLEERLMGLKPKDRVKGLKLEDRLMGLKPEDRVKGLKPEEQLIGLKPEEQLIGLKPEEQLIGLKPKERVKGLKPEDRLDGLSTEEIEDYLKTLKKK